MYLQAARVIADHLLENAVFNDKRDEVNWIGISIIGNKESRWNIAALNSYLYDGVAGTAIFFNACRKVYKDKKYDQICSALDNTLFNYTNFLSDASNISKVKLTGAFSGESSLIYVYEILYNLTQEKKYLDYAEKHALIVEKLLLADTNYDILLGNAGAIHVLLNLHSMTEKQQYCNLALEAAEHVVSHALKLEDGIGWKSNITVNPLAGFSHGVAGIASALLRVGTIGKSVEFINKAKEALNYENSLYMPDLRNWCDKRELAKVPSEKVGVGPVAWCHGASGILLSRLMMKTIVYKLRLIKTLKLLLKQRCHMGLMEFIAYVMVIWEILKY